MMNKDVENLLSVYNSVTEDNETGGFYLGGYEPLEDLSDKCWEIGKKFEDLAIPAFVLHSIFKKIANDQDERIVTIEECNDLYNSLNKPIVNLIECMRAGLPYLNELKELVNIFMELW